MMKENTKNNMIVLKCSKISYDPEFDDGSLPTSINVNISPDYFDCITPDADDCLEDYDEEILQYLIDEVSEMTGCPVLNLKWKKSQKN